MSRVTIDVVATSNFSLSDLMEPDERLLWTGNPEHGIHFFQPIGAERVYLGSMVVGIVVLWLLFPLIISRGTFHPVIVAFVFGVFTVIFLLVAYAVAASRQFVVSQLFYVVTNQRAIVCRHGRNWRFADRLYVVANPHSASYPYAILPTRPHPSLRIGTLIDQNELQPFGFGLSHPGQPASWGHVTVPVVFEQISDAEAVLDLIRSNV